MATRLWRTLAIGLVEGRSRERETLICRVAVKGVGPRGRRERMASCPRAALRMGGSDIGGVRMVVGGEGVDD